MKQFNAPSFWYPQKSDKQGIALQCMQTLLRPLSTVHEALSKLRYKIVKPQQINIPVICCGNLTVGGNGKTPLAIELHKRIASRGIRAHFLTRGYGSRKKIKKPYRVIIGKDTPKEIGDEAVILAMHGDTWVSPDRVLSAVHAMECGAQTVIMDDGFQNHYISKDLSIVVVDVEYNFGNERIFPAGPLREKVKDGLKRADLVVLVGDSTDGNTYKTLEKRIIDTGTPVAHGEIKPSSTGLHYENTSVVAFAGIGHPEKFFSMLEKYGAIVKRKIAFPDHTTYSHKILNRLESIALDEKALLVTTEKDIVKIPSQYIGSILPVMVFMDLNNWSFIDNFIDEKFPLPPCVELDEDSCIA